MMLFLASLLLATAATPAASTPEDYVVKPEHGLADPGGKVRYKQKLPEALKTCAANRHCRGVAYQGAAVPMDQGVYLYFLGSTDTVTPLAGWTSHVLREHELTTCSAEKTEKAGKVEPEKVHLKISDKETKEAKADLEAQKRIIATKKVQNAARAVEEEAKRRATLLEEEAADEAAEDDEEEEDDEPIPSAEAEAQYQQAQRALFALGDDGLRNVTEAVEAFNLSATQGHAGSQFMMGFLYTIGLGVPPSEMLAVLYYTFSAMGGNAEAALALSYRYTYGYGVPRSCAEARRHYRAAADRVALHYRKQAVAPAVTKIRLSDPTALRTKQKEEDLLQYYQYNADRGDSPSQMVLGYAFMWGIRGVEQDAAQARKYFEMAVDKGDPSAYGALGTIYSQGINSPTNPIARNYTKAHEYFSRGEELKHPVSYNGMGYLAMRGGGTRRNYTKAVEHFTKAAALKNPEALYNLGVLYQEGKGVEKDKTRAEGFLKSASAKGQVLAHWMLGTDETKACNSAVHHLKTVSEQGISSKRIADAHKDYLDGDYSSALLKYLIASEYGQEIAHTNTAYMLDNGLGLEELEITLNPAYLAADLSENTTSKEEFTRYSLALKYYKKATEQGSIEAPVKVADYHYYGQGADADVHKALSSYKLAVGRGSHQAMFNLGYMHEHGISIAQSFQLAKRYYDQAFHSNEHAYWPITLALMKLQLHWYFVDWMDGSESQVKTTGAKQAAPSELTLWGHPVEDVLLGSLLAMLFLTLFIRHTARQVQVQAPAQPTPAAPVAPAAAPAAAAAAAAAPEQEEEEEEEGDAVADAHPPAEGEEGQQGGNGAS